MTGRGEGKPISVGFSGLMGPTAPLFVSAQATTSWQGNAVALSDSLIRSMVDFVDEDFDVG
jgi:hypothetical protein